MDVQCDQLLFEDGSALKADNIIWATGFEPNFSWLQFPKLFDSAGKIIHERGVAPIEGLFFLGMSWQHRRGSALLLGVSDDAKYLYESIVNGRK